MSFPRYESYRESGVASLGEVPIGWEVKPLKYLTRFVSGGTPSKERADFWDGDVPWASAKDLKGDVLVDTLDHITSEAIKEGAAQLVPADSILVLVRGMMLARTFPVSLAACPVAINQDIKALLVKPGVSYSYLAWTLRGTQNETLIRLDEAGHGTKALRMDAWTSMLVPLPSLQEQIAIAAFLDRETDKIDALVEAQRRLIELLKEKRQAIISHTVTKGFDPTVAMKDSGIEWLGEVPAHWAVKPLKRTVADITVGIVVEPSKYYVEDGVPALRSLNVQPGRVVAEDLVYISEQANELHKKSKLRAGDIVAVRTGQPGTAAVVPEHLDGINCIDLIVIRADDTFSRKFLCWYFASDAAQFQFAEGSGGAIQQHFNVGAAKQLLVCLPPISEQHHIAEALDRQTAALDGLVAAAECGIKLLQERRAALISAAVTGKIDVRQAAREVEVV